LGRRVDRIDRKVEKGKKQYLSELYMSSSMQEDEKVRGQEEES
jgi:ribosomal protein L1